MPKNKLHVPGHSATLIPSDRLLTSLEVCRILNIRRLHLYELLRQKQIQSVRIGRLHRFVPSYVADYIREHTNGGEA